MGRPQLDTPMQVDNSNYYGIVNRKIQQKLSNAMDMHFIGLYIYANNKTLTNFGNLEWTTVGIIILNITRLHVTK